MTYSPKPFTHASFEETPFLNIVGLRVKGGKIQIHYADDKKWYTVETGSNNLRIVLDRK